MRALRLDMYISRLWFCMQSDDPNNNEAPAVQIPKEYQSGVIDAIKQAIPSYISNALGAGR